MPRFVLLEHDHPDGLHWDFMLEHGDVLWTWSLPAFPRPSEPMSSARLPDHRLAYLDYEGEISGGRGTVRRCDRGTYQALEDGQASVTVALNGGMLIGRVSLELETHRHPETWRFVYQQSPEDKD